MPRMQAAIRNFVKQHWVALVCIGVVIAIVSTALLFRLGTILPGYSANEVATYHASTSLKEIWLNPINAPYHVVVHALQSVIPNDLIAVRMASVFVGWLTIVIFFLLVHRWHGLRTAIFGTLLFGTSSWFLHVSRLGTPDVVLFGLFSIVACGVWLREHKAPGAVILGLLISGLLLYTPGMAWFLGIGLLWQWSSIDRAFKHNKGSLTLGTILFLGTLTPLLLHFYKHPGRISEWLCLPSSWSQPLHLLHNIIDVPIAIFFRSDVANPETWLGRLALLTIFGSIMFLLGAYVYLQHARLARARLFALLAVLGSVVIGLSDGKISLTVLVPFVFIVASAGIGYLVETWYAVFPRNPIAKILGAVIVSAAIGIACLYNIRSYFVAWPQASATRALFTHEKP